MIKVPFTVMTGTKYPQMLQGLVKVVSLFYKAVVGGTAGPAMAGPLFWPKMVLAGPLFLWPGMFFG